MIGHSLLSTVALVTGMRLLSVTLCIVAKRCVLEQKLSDSL